MIEEKGSRNATRGDIVIVVVTLGVWLIPMFLLTVFPDVKLVQAVLGNGRMFLFWGVLALVLFVYRRPIDRWFDRKFPRSGPRREG